VHLIKRQVEGAPTEAAEPRGSLIEAGRHPTAATPATGLHRFPADSPTAMPSGRPPTWTVRVTVPVAGSNIASPDHAKRLAWMDSLRTIGDLHPQTVVAGHRRPDAKDTAQTIPDTIAYPQDFDDMLAQQLPVADTIA
jgi:hypothetical protein